MHKAIEDFVRSLGLDAYLVGGAVRDELLGLESKDADFLVPGVDYEGLRRALEPHGRVEEFEVAGRRVGVRLYPRDRDVRALAPAGIEFAPPRVERSTGPGRHEFEIVADPSLSVEDDMGRRDFTVNAMARRLATGELVDPFGGAKDLKQRVLRTVGPRSFAEDPLRIVRGLRLVSQLGLAPTEPTLQQMRDEARNVALVSGERVGGGLRADGMGELSKLLLGREPADALRLARETGVLDVLLPEVSDNAFDVVQRAADAGAPLAVRLAALFDDAGAAARALRRLRYPLRVETHVTRLVRARDFPLGGVDERYARRFLREHGDELAFDLAALRAAMGDDTAPLRSLLEQERTQPHRLQDLAIGGDDLLELGYEEGPAVGKVLNTLLDDVVDDPALNTHERLLARARELKS